MYFSFLQNVLFVFGIIQSDDSYQLFEYDASGRISEWKYENSSQKLSDVYQSSYKYLDDEGVILITSEEKYGAEEWRFNEKLFLNQNGTADHVTGNVIMVKDGERQMMKNYTVGFEYNSRHQLTKVKIVEKPTDDTGWEETSGLEWFIDLEWNDNNLTKHTEYSNPDYPMFTKTIAYFGVETAHYIPIVQGVILRHYYLPLQYQGVFGTQSIGLVRSMTASSNTQEYTSTFSYDIATSIYSSTVEAYYELRRGKEVKYEVVWDVIL